MLEAHVFKSTRPIGMSGSMLTTRTCAISLALARQLDMLSSRLYKTFTTLGQHLSIFLFQACIRLMGLGAEGPIPGGTSSFVAVVSDAASFSFCAFNCLLATVLAIVVLGGMFVYVCDLKHKIFVSLMAIGREFVISRPRTSSETVLDWKARVY